MTTQTSAARLPGTAAAQGQAAGSFDYTVYICATAEKLWNALTVNELRKHWWRGHTVETDWRVGSPIVSRFPDGSLEFKGHVLEANSPRTLAFEVDEVSWTDEFEGQGPNRLHFTIESFTNVAKLTLRNVAPPKMLELVRLGWPAVLSSLKSLLETGTPLPLDAVFGPERNPGKANAGAGG